VHKIEGNNGHLIHVVRNGYHELHHLDSNGDSGSGAPKMAKPNPKFIGTSFHYAKEHIIDKDRTLKLSGTEHMYPHIKPIAERLAKKHDYDIEHGTEKIGEHNMPYSLIKRKLKEHIVFPWVKEQHIRSTRK
jgi:hypothetical protein